jgi:GT2 family glycosyltransferase
MTNLPTFSVIIPTYNRAEALLACLDGISQLDYPRERFQVFVVNDGGRTIPDQALDSFGERFELEFLTQTNSGPSAARNFGASHASGRWLAFTDDDCIPDPNWLKELARAAKESPTAALGGGVDNGVPLNHCAQATHLLFTYLYEYYHGSKLKRAQLGYFTSNNFALPRDVFSSIGGFEPTMRNAEDRELCARLVGSGRFLRYVPSARVMHYRPMNFTGFWRLHVSYGRGSSDYHERQKSRGVTRITPEPFSFYTGLLRYPSRQTPGRNVMRLAALLVLSQIANAYGFANKRMKGRTMRAAYPEQRKFQKSL